MFEKFKKSVRRFIFKRFYEAASNTRRNQNWRKKTVNPFTPAADKATISARALNLRNNTAFGKRFELILGSHCSGVTVSANRESAGAEALNKVLKAWFKNPKMDFKEMMSFNTMQNKLVTSVAFRGAVLVKRVRLNSREMKELGLNIPLQLQLLPIDYLDTTREGKLSSGGKILQGIQFNEKGRLEGYYIYKYHPKDPVNFSTSSFFVPRSEMLHIFNLEDIEGVDGVTWLAPILSDTKNLYDYKDAQLVKQKIAASYAMFLENTGLDEDDLEDEDFELIETIEPATVNLLPAGRRAVFPDPPRVDSVEQYIRTMERHCFAGVGFSYETGTGDYSQVNFTSGRMGQTDQTLIVEHYQSHILVDQFIKGFWPWFIEAAIAVNPRIEDIEPIFTLPKKPFVNPQAEINAKLAAVRGGGKTPEEFTREVSGRDFTEFLQEYASSKALIEKFGLTFDTEVDKVTQQGQKQNEG